MRSAHPLRRLDRYARVHRHRTAAAVACSVLNKLFDLAPPGLIGAAVDIVVRRDESFVASFGLTTLTEQLVALAVITVIIWALESLFEYLQKVTWRNLAQTVQHELRIDAYTHVQDLELAYFEDRSTGGLLAILNDDVNQLERFLDSGANDLLQVATTVVAIGAVFFSISPTLSLMSFVPVPLVLWGSLYFQARIAPRYAAVRERVGDLSAMLVNNLSGIVTIKSFTAEEREVTRIRHASEAYEQSNRRAIRLSSAFSPLIRMVIVCGFTATLVYGGLLAEEGVLEVGTYSVLVFLTQRLLWPLTRLGVTFDLYQRAMASTARILNLLDTRVSIQDGDVPLERKDVRGDLVLDDVHFAYGNGVPVLAGLSMRAQAGETVAVVGPTGSGKSTLVKLLLRFYEPTRGVITLDGIELSSIRIHDLREAIGLVSQDVFLFHGTVRDNIAFGRPKASHEEVEKAARAAEAHDFIVALPDGYDTIVGERGQKLSGGQRQRVSIARAILKDPAILILDEATSAVDNETEAAIQRSLARISEGRTTLVIAHRLSTIRDAHRIYVMDDGRVSEEGRHGDLLEHAGQYAALWDVQTGVRTR